MRHPYAVVYNELSVVVRRYELSTPRPVKANLLREALWQDLRYHS
jgi:hypothetical protein